MRTRIHFCAVALALSATAAVAAQDAPDSGAAPTDADVEPIGAAQSPVPEPTAGHSPPPGYVQPAPAQAEVAAAPARDHDDIRYTDAHADRVILSSTAETHPAGTFFVSDYDVELLQLGFAFTDRAQVSISGVPPFLKDQPFFFDVSLKLNVYRGRRFRTAFVGSLTAFFDPDDEAIVGGRLTAVETLCFTRTCGTSLSGTLAAFANNQMNDFLPLYGALGLSIRVSRLVSILLEPSYLFVLGNAGIVGINGVVVGAGLRLSGRNFGVDLTLMRGFGDAFDGVNDTLVLGLPFIAFTYRTDGDWADPPRAPVSAPARAFWAP